MMTSKTLHVWIQNYGGIESDLVYHVLPEEASIGVICVDWCGDVSSEMLYLRLWVLYQRICSFKASLPINRIRLCTAAAFRYRASTFTMGWYPFTTIKDLKVEGFKQSEAVCSIKNSRIQGFKDLRI